MTSETGSGAGGNSRPEPIRFKVPAPDLDPAELRTYRTHEVCGGSDTTVRPSTPADLVAALEQNPELRREVAGKLGDEFSISPMAAVADRQRDRAETAEARARELERDRALMRQLVADRDAALADVSSEAEELRAEAANLRQQLDREQSRCRQVQRDLESVAQSKRKARDATEKLRAERDHWRKQAKLERESRIEFGQSMLDARAELARLRPVVDAACACVDWFRNWCPDDTPPPLFVPVFAAVDRYRAGGETCRDGAGVSAGNEVPSASAPVPPDPALEPCPEPVRTCETCYARSTDDSHWCYWAGRCKYYPGSHTPNESHWVALPRPTPAPETGPWTAAERVTALQRYLQRCEHHEQTPPLITLQTYVDSIRDALDADRGR